MVLSCDFKGYISPEIVKTRPVVVISPTALPRHGLFTVIPLSTTPPDPIEEYHYLLKGNPIVGSTQRLVWAKCDLVASVCRERLDRIKIARGRYDIGHVSMEQVNLMRLAAARSFGIELGSD